MIVFIHSDCWTRRVLQTHSPSETEDVMWSDQIRSVPPSGALSVRLPSRATKQGQNLCVCVCKERDRLSHTPAGWDGERAEMRTSLSTTLLCLREPGGTFGLEESELLDWDEAVWPLGRLIIKGVELSEGTRVRSEWCLSFSHRHSCSISHSSVLSRYVTRVNTGSVKWSDC